MEKVDLTADKIDELGSEVIKRVYIDSMEDEPVENDGCINCYTCQSSCKCECWRD